MHRGLSILLLSGLLGAACWAQAPAESSSKQAKKPPANAPLPRSEDESASGQSSGESSSRSTKTDLSPPPGEAPAPGVGGASDVHELKPWDPHKADKNVEVGDFYFKQKNYRAAESRYSEALYWQDNHAIAMFRLAEAEEKLGKFGEARKNYAAYLKILPDGDFSAPAKQGLERLKDKPNAQEKAEKK
jgi:tetratricopeptide (TPR) repeat protein